MLINSYNCCIYISYNGIIYKYRNYNMKLYSNVINNIVERMKLWDFLEDYLSHTVKEKLIE